MTALFRGSVLVMAPFVGLGALGAYEIGLARTAGPVNAIQQVGVVERELVDQPKHWVPFAAELRRVFESDGSVFVGRTYRASDGSTRNETGRSLSSIDSIAIKNIPQGIFYLWNGYQGWTSQPMDMPPGGLAAPMVRVFNRANMTEVSDTVEGFKLIKQAGGGVERYMAPELNMFYLITLVPCSRNVQSVCGTWYSNIKLGEPDVDFVPPSDAGVTALSEPGGIVKKAGPSGK